MPLSLCLWALGRIRRESEHYTGRSFAFVGLALSLVLLFGGAGYGGYVYATEVPDGTITEAGLRHNLNVGIQYVEAVESFPPEKWDAVLAIDLSSAFHATRAVFAGMKAKKPEAKLLSLVETLIADLTKPWDPAMVGDPVQERLKDIIAARRRKTKMPAKKAKAEEAEPETPSNVVSIMDALKKSISQEKKKKKGG